MPTPLTVISYGLDYVRYKVFSDVDVRFIQERLHYLDIEDRRLHGTRCVDLTGSMLATIRMLDDIESVVLSLSTVYPVSRIDCYIDVEGDILSSIKTNGTTISNNNRVETKYSHHLSRRGNLATFARTYDAMVAGHYETPATRFEVEFKRGHARGIIGSDGWKTDIVAVTIAAIRTLFHIDIRIDAHPYVEWRADTQPYAHPRERFYERYGNSILRDISDMGVQGLYQYIVHCLENKEKCNDV